MGLVLGAHQMPVCTVSNSLNWVSQATAPSQTSHRRWVAHQYQKHSQTKFARQAVERLAKRQEQLKLLMPRNRVGHLLPAGNVAAYVKQLRARGMQCHMRVRYRIVQSLSQYINFSQR